MKRLIPINLQFFGENDNAATAADNAGIETTETTQTQQTTQNQAADNSQVTQQNTQQAQTQNPATEKMYTKKEYDDMALRQFNTGILNTMREAGFTDVDEKNFKKSLANFKKWTDDQKTAEQLAKEALDAANIAAQTAQAKLTKYEQNDALRNAGVEESFIGYVGYEVNQMAASTNSTFEDAMTVFLATNNAYLKANAQSAQQSQQSQQQTRTVTATTSAESQEEAKPEMALNFIGVRPRK